MLDLPEEQPKFKSLCIDNIALQIADNFKTVENGSLSQ